MGLANMEIGSFEEKFDETVEKNHYINLINKHDNITEKDLDKLLDTHLTGSQTRSSVAITAMITIMVTLITLYQTNLKDFQAQNNLVGGILAGIMFVIGGVLILLVLQRATSNLKPAAINNQFSLYLRARKHLSEKNRTQTEAPVKDSVN